MLLFVLEGLSCPNRFSSLSITWATFSNWFFTFKFRIRFYIRSDFDIDQSCVSCTNTFPIISNGPLPWLYSWVQDRWVWRKNFLLTTCPPPRTLNVWKWGSEFLVLHNTDLFEIGTVLKIIKQLRLFGDIWILSLQKIHFVNGLLYHLISF